MRRQYNKTAIATVTLFRIFALQGRRHNSLNVSAYAFQLSRCYSSASTPRIVTRAAPISGLPSGRGGCAFAWTTLPNSHPTNKLKHHTLRLSMSNLDEESSDPTMSNKSLKRSASTSATEISANKTNNQIDPPSTQYFLLKSEPSEYSINDLQRDITEEWDGIRNYQARNVLRSMNIGDRAFFYHSKSSKPGPGIVGTVRIARTAQPDPTALDPSSDYYDPKCTKQNCKWDSVLVEFEEKFPVVLTLKELKDIANNDPEGVIAGMALFKQSRLSVVPLTDEQWGELTQLVEIKISGSSDSDDGSHKVVKRTAKRKKTEN